MLIPAASLAFPFFLATGGIAIAYWLPNLDIFIFLGAIGVPAFVLWVVFSRIRERRTEDLITRAVADGSAADIAQATERILARRGATSENYARAVQALVSVGMPEAALTVSRVAAARFGTSREYDLHCAGLALGAARYDDAAELLRHLQPHAGTDDIYVRALMLTLRFEATTDVAEIGQAIKALETELYSLTESKDQSVTNRCGETALILNSHRIRLLIQTDHAASPTLEHR